MASTVFSNMSTDNGTVTVPPVTMPAVLGPVGTTIAIFFTLFGVFGNIVTILVSWKLNKQKKQWTHALVISVAVVDLAFSLFEMPLNIDTYIHLSWNSSTVLCQIHAYIPGVLVAIQLAHTTYIMFLKHLIVVHNIKNIPEGKTNFLVIVLLWALPALFVLLTVYCLGNDKIHYQYFPQILRCSIVHCHLSKTGAVALAIMLVIITYSQGRIYWYVKKSHNNIEDIAVTININRIYRQQEATLAKTFTMTSVALLLAYAPRTVLNAVDREVQQPPELYFFCSVLLWTAAFLNPTVYVLTNKRFRTACWMLFVQQTQLQPRKTQRQPLNEQRQPMEAGVQPMEAEMQLMETEGQPMEAEGQPMEEMGQPMEGMEQPRQEQGKTSHCQAELTSPSNHFSKDTKSQNTQERSMHISMVEDHKYSMSSGHSD